MNLSYNLALNPVVPVRNEKHTSEEVSLRDALSNAHLYGEIAHDSPLVTATFHALLLAILYSIWNDKEWDIEDQEGDWQRLWKQGHFDAESIDAYFSKWSDRFDVFHPDYPFYQVKGLEMNEVSPLYRLATEEQNAPTMFTNRANPDWASPSPKLAAQLLITIQNFALGFGKSSKARIDGVEVEPPYSADGPLLRGLTVWPSGENLFRTLMLNLVPHDRQQGDKPCWENDAPHELRDKLVNGKRQTVTPKGICDRLTLQARLLLLQPVQKDGQVSVPGAYFTQGRSLEKDDAGRPSFHPLKLYSETKANGILPIALSEGKAIWRNAHALLDEDARGKDPQNPLAFVARLVGDRVLSGKTDLQVVGVASEPGKAAKFLLWRHDRLPVPAALLIDGGLVFRLEKANDDAGRVADEMRRRFSIVARTFLAGGKDGGNKPDPDDVKALIDKFDPRRPFWPRLEAPFYALLEGLATDPMAALQAWDKAMNDAARLCLRDACNGLGTTPKAMSAVAQIDLRDGYNLEYLQNPQGYSANAKARKAAATAASTS